MTLPHIPTDLVPAVLGLVPSPLRAYAKLTEAERADRRREMLSAIEAGLMPYLLKTAGLSGCAPTVPAVAPLEGRPGTISTPSGLAVTLAFLASSEADYDGLPPTAQAVCQAEMWLYSHSRCLVGVFDGRSWRAGWLGADEQQQRVILAAAEDMARRVAEGRPPAPADTDLAAVKRVFASDTEGEVRLSREHVALVDLLYDLRRRIAALSTRAHAVEAKLRYAVGGHRLGRLPDGRAVKLSASGSGRRLVVRRYGQ